MPNIREPALHPTQATIGMQEVEAKPKAWAAKSDGKGAEFLGIRMIPVIPEPKGRSYVIGWERRADYAGLKTDD